MLTKLKVAITLVFAIIVQTGNAQEKDPWLNLDSMVVQFETDKAILKPLYKTQIDALISTSDTLAVIRWIVEAHTDNVGADAYNLGLSAKRAEAIKQYILQNTSSPRAIEVAFFGEQQELTSNLTAKGRSLNRRAKLKLQYIPEIIIPELKTVLIKGIVVVQSTGDGLVADVVISGKEFREIITTDSLGHFEILLQPEKVYKFQAFPEDKRYTSTFQMAKTNIESFADRVKIEVSAPQQAKKSVDKEFLELNGKVIDNDTRQPLIEAQVLVKGSNFQDTIRTDMNGNFSFPITVEMPKELSAFHEGYFFDTEQISPTHSTSVPIILELSAIQIGRQFTMHLNFKSGTPILLQQSIPKLHHLLKAVRDAEGYCFKIDGHVNFPNAPKVTKNSFSWDLSWDRARTIRNFLVDKGINKHRLSYEGFGNWHMIEPFARTEKMMQKNRRVEIRIVECQ